MSKTKAVGLAVVLGACMMLMEACEVAPSGNPSSSVGQASSASSANPSAGVSTSSVSPAQTKSNSSSTNGASSSSGYTESSNNTPDVLMRDDGTGIVSFNMTPSEVCQAVNGFGLSCSPSSSPDQFGSVYAGRSQFEFDSQGLRRFSTADDGLQSERGLRVGDPVSRLLQLYGTDYQTDGANGTLCYDFELSSGIELSACMGSEDHEASGTSDDLITGWGLARDLAV